MGFNLGGLVASMFSKGIESNPGFGIKAPGDVPYNVTGDPEEWMKKHPADEPAVRPSWWKRYSEPEAARAQEMANFSYKMQPALAEQELAAKLKQVESLKVLTDRLDDARIASNFTKLPQSAIPQFPYEEKPWDYLFPSSSRAPISMTPEQAVAMKYTGSPVELETFKNALSNMKEDLGGLRASATGRQLTASNAGGLPEITADALIATQRGVSIDEAEKTRTDRINRSVFGEKFRVANNLAKVAATEAEKAAYLAGQGKNWWSTQANTQGLNAKKENILSKVIDLGDKAKITTMNEDGTLSIEDNPAGHQHGRQSPLSMLGGIDGLNMQTGLPGLIPSVSGVNKAVDLGSREFIPPMRLRAYGAPPPEKLRKPTTAPKVDDNTDDIVKFIPDGLKREAAEAESDATNEKAIKDYKEVLSIKKRLKQLEEPLRPVYVFDESEPSRYEPYSKEVLKKSQPARLAEAAKLAARLKELHKNHGAGGSW